jgi:REP element-mobilizing transposase RayT
MPTYVSAIAHIIFATQDVKPLIRADIKDRLYAHIESEFRRLKVRLIKIGGTEDHVHLVFEIPRSISMADLMEQVKKHSSDWAKGELPDCRDFYWMRGYTFFATNNVMLPKLLLYVDEDVQRHQSLPFAQELADLLSIYQVSYDERYFLK